MKYVKLIPIFLLTIMTILSSCKSKAQVNDNNPTQSERKSTPNRKGGERPSAAQLLAKMDTDKDGKLSKTEVKGPLLQDFAKVDTNGDGFISKEELENAPKPKRQGPPRERN